MKRNMIGLLLGASVLVLASWLSRAEEYGWETLGNDINYHTDVNRGHGLIHWFIISGSKHRHTFQLNNYTSEGDDIGRFDIEIRIDSRGETHVAGQKSEAATLKISFAPADGSIGAQSMTVDITPGKQTRESMMIIGVPWPRGKMAMLGTVYVEGTGGYKGDVDYSLFVIPHGEKYKKQ